MKTVERCTWCKDDPLYVRYHDMEWGAPLHDDRGLFEFLILEGAQAGLSWLTILRRREAYRQAFDGFDFHKVARYGEERIAQLTANPNIIRNRLKIRAAVSNARIVLEILESHSSLDAYIWSFVDGEPRQNAWRTVFDIPSETPASRAMSKAMKQRGFQFVGPTICYAYMQATGMVNDHVTTCFRHAQLGGHPDPDSPRG